MHRRRISEFALRHQKMFDLLDRNKINLLHYLVDAVDVMWMS